MLGPLAVSLLHRRAMITAQHLGRTAETDDVSVGTKIGQYDVIRQGVPELDS